MRKTFLVALVLMVELLWICCDSAPSDDPGLRNVINYQKQCVFRLRFEDGRYTGTGFVINTLGNMVTCAHVVDSSRDDAGIYVDALTAENYVKLDLESGKTFSDMITFDVSVDTVIPMLDLALLSLNLGKPRYKKNINVSLPVSRSLFARFADSDSLWEGQEVFACAYIDDDFVISKPVIAKGIVSTIRDRCFDPRLNNEVDILQFDLNISKGNSGGPVFRPHDGRVVGVLDWGIFRDSKWQTGYAIALSTNQLVEKLKELDIPLDFR